MCWQKTMSRAQLYVRRLHDAAVHYCSSDDMERCYWLYRDKNNEYFQTIEASGGVMHTERKDDGGDPRSPINYGQLRGLFFMTNNVDGDPPSHSYFGPRRIQIEADELFRLAPKLYFADFYCTKRLVHYVILVMTRPRSQADLFCRSQFVLLDGTNNPFLRTYNGQLYMPATDDLDVEVYYTEDLNISELLRSEKAVMRTAQTRGQCHSTPGSRKKDRFCRTCNPWPI